MKCRRTGNDREKEDSIKKYAHLYPEFKSKYIVVSMSLRRSTQSVDPRIEPLMRAAYEKYSASRQRPVLHNGSLTCAAGGWFTYRRAAAGGIFFIYTK